MRTLLISLAAAGSALAFATPASAQYYPAPQPYGYGAQPYGYGAPYGNAYGYNNFGQARSLQVRINNVERQINRLDRRNRIGEREADRLRHEANRIERRIRSASRNGLNPYEANDINRRIAVLEQRVQYASSHGWNRYGSRYGWNGTYGNNGYAYDRDRDGRDDRYEDDRGRDHDD
ncbi:MAG: hypothetical protein ACJ8D5_04045 [Sphingomicrobium sp.]